MDPVLISIFSVGQYYQYLSHVPGLVVRCFPARQDRFLITIHRFLSLRRVVNHGVATEITEDTEIITAKQLVSASLRHNAIWFRPRSRAVETRGRSRTV